MSPRWRSLWADAASLAVPLGAYAFATGAGLVIVSALLLANGLTDDAAGWGVLGGCWLATVGGVASGQLAALLRLRAWVVATGFVLGVAAIMTALTIVAVNELQTLGIGLVVTAFLGPFFFVSGHLSLSTNAGLPSLFAPILWLTSAILAVAEKRGTSAAWFAGEKWAIWDVFTAPILGFGVLCALVFLASREQHRLHRWRTDPVAPILSVAPAQIRRAGSGIGCGGIFALSVLTLALTLASAVSAPYLWRSEADTDPPDSDATTVDGQPTPDGTDPQPDGASGDGGGPSDPIRRAAEQAGTSLIALFLILALLLAGLAVFGPPLRRMLLLQHLRRPFWPISPTRRIAQHWRLAEIALGDGGVPRQPGDDADTLVRRARTQVAFVDADALARCAEIADRVAYGVAIRPEDVMYARRTAEMTYQTVWDELTEWERFKAMYRAL